VKRRQLLKLGAVAGGAFVAGCDRGWSELARTLESRPEKAASPSEATIGLETHLLNRLTYGPRPGDREELASLGAEGWIERQLSPGSIDDTACDLRARRFESLHASAGDIFEFKRSVVESELLRMTILRAATSRRQLLEVMTGFWTDHLNISIGKGDCAWFKTVDDREIVRRHALGNFASMVRASALSPAMLVYLDGATNRRADGREKPNENYARELMELHTLGVHGGYTQKDVMEAARCLTGWSVKGGWNRGKVVFEPGAHDDGAKVVLGATFPAGQGEKDLDQLIDVVVRHPATAKHVAWKLCRRFIADEPPAGAVERVAAAFRDSNFEIKPALRALFASPDFLASRGSRLKRPFHFVVSAVRAVDAETDGGGAIQNRLHRMGQAPFQYPTPDGYPEEPRPWLGTLLWRWNFALELAANRVAGTRVDLAELAGRFETRAALAAHVFGRSATEEESALVRDANDGQAVALLLSSPAFQRF
jgi:uncharacterized protein (DUF1800 family)